MHLRSKIRAVWDFTSGRLINSYQRFGVAAYLLIPACTKWHFTPSPLSEHEVRHLSYHTFLSVFLAFRNVAGLGRNLNTLPYDCQTKIRHSTADNSTLSSNESNNKRTTLYNVVLFLLGDSPWFEFCVDFSEHCLFHLHRWCKHTPPMKMEQTECSETSTHKIQTTGNRPKEIIQQLEHGGGFKSRKYSNHWNLKALEVKKRIFWFVTPCSVTVTDRFGGTLLRNCR